MKYEGRRFTVVEHTSIDVIFEVTSEPVIGFGDKEYLNVKNVQTGGEFMLPMYAVEEMDVETSLDFKWL